jgi:predicted branched-subunit amino acid permease
MNRIPVVAVSIGMATGIYAISFGAIGVTAGLSILETMLLSLVMFSGASQFAFVGVIATGGMAAIPTAIASAWLLGIRNGFYALRMAPVLGMPGIAKLLSAQLTIDESTAVATAQSTTSDEKRGFWWTGISVFIFWNLLTLAGALLGDQIGDPANFGLDSAAAAAFLGLVWPRLSSNLYRLIGLSAFIVAIATSAFVPAGIPVLLGAFVAALIQYWGRR